MYCIYSTYFILQSTKYCTFIMLIHTELYRLYRRYSHKAALPNIYKNDDSKVRTNVILFWRFAGYNSDYFIQSLVTLNIPSHETPT